MKKRLIEILIISSMIIGIMSMISFISFYFVNSYDAYDESVGMKYCEIVANKSGTKINTVLNDFMYDSQKYYSCVIGDSIPLIYIFDEEGKVIMYKNYIKYQKIASELEGNISYGLYNNQIVIVQKIVKKDSLDIYYYDELGNCVFDLRGNKNNE